jgi:hypothetical protein
MFDITVEVAQLATGTEIIHDLWLADNLRDSWR